MTDWRGLAGGTTGVNTSLKLYLRCYQVANRDGYENLDISYFCPLTGRPAHVPAAEEVDVEVFDGLAAVGAGVQDGAVAIV